MRKSKQKRENTSTVSMLEYFKQVSSFFSKHTKAGMEFQQNLATLHPKTSASSASKQHMKEKPCVCVTFIFLCFGSMSLKLPKKKKRSRRKILNPWIIPVLLI